MCTIEKSVQKSCQSTVCGSIVNRASNYQAVCFLEFGGKFIYNIVKDTFIGFVTAVLTVVKSKTKIANVVTKTHITTEIEKIDLGVGFGEVGFSSTTIISENEEPALLCAYSDVGLEESRHGVSVNEEGVLGAGFGFSDEGNVFVNAQLASVLHAEVSLGIDGVGGSIGVDVGKTSYDFEIKIGWGTLALIPLIPLFNSGEESNSPAYAY